MSIGFESFNRNQVSLTRCLVNILDELFLDQLIDIRLTGLDSEGVVCKNFVHGHFFFDEDTIGGGTSTKLVKLR